MLLTLLACDAPTPVRTSTPITPPSDAVVTTELPPVEESRPDGRASVQFSQVALDELVGFGLETLEGDAAKKAHYLLNTSVGSCAPCMDAGTSLAVCVQTLPEGCENTPDLVKRLVRLAPELHADELRNLIDYAEPWVPLPDWLEGDAPVTLVFAVDYQSPFDLRAQKAIESLQERYGDKLDVVWLHAPDPNKHPMAVPAATVMLQAGDHAGAATLHRSLLDNYASLDAETLTELSKAAGVPLGGDVSQELLRHGAAAEAAGVRGTPTIFLNGYRFRGMRPWSAYAPHIDALLGDQGLE